MADTNTIRLGKNSLGEKQWGVKAENLLATNTKTFANYPDRLTPLEFSVTRASGATRVNELGLIETVGDNVPRIDFLNDSKGTLLVEPQRTNSEVWSQLFDVTTSWSSNSVTITNNTTISPDGTTNASTLNGTGSWILRDAIGASSTGTWTVSAYVKAVTPGTNDTFRLSVGGNNFSENLTATSEWVRYTFTFTNGGATLCGFLRDSSSNDSDLYIWGVQVEAGSYATSYIPTNGQVQTRNQDFVTKTGIPDLIGQNEGTLYLELYHKNETSADRDILSIWFSSTRYMFRARINGNTLSFVYNGAGNARPLTNNVTLLPNQINKIAVKYLKSTKTATIFLNGVNMGSTVGVDPYPTDPQGGINVGGWFGTPAGLFGEVTIYDTQLADAQLITLTTL